MMKKQMLLVIGGIPSLLATPGTRLDSFLVVLEELWMMELSVELKVLGLVDEAALGTWKGFFGSRPGLTELERKCKIWAS